ncbi:MAG: DNA mismatch repair endonuclease MutL, partial [Chloroflexi bacterium]|nr:DNA mismatch repair endonuclease MutL [Chloroflexota bacterium]
MDVSESRLEGGRLVAGTASRGAIRILPQDVSSKIAAGEVVERPASVVKELVENALDAGASEISIEIVGGGAEHILVADNGSGIAGDEVELAFQRFATSKVADSSDLEAISTLGFRGEALPSIAAVASVSLITRAADEEFGTRVEVVEGSTPKREPHGAPHGTTVSVRHLFRNLPARRKFLRTVATETTRVQTLVTRYALAYPEVRFRLSADGSQFVSTTGSGDLREAIASVYGLDVGQAMLEVSPDPEDGDAPLVRVTGMTGPPSLDRANRGRISLFVNRRWVQSRSLGYALEQAYHGFLMERRFPVAVVNVALPHEDVDVNVHPAKTEVRFRREGQVFGALQQAVRRAVIAHSPVPEIGRVDAARARHGGESRARAFWPVEPFAAAGPGDIGRTPGPSPAQAPPLLPQKTLPALRVLGQVQATYVAAEGPDGMYLIDQHAAHERVVFERVRAGISSSAPEVQSLLEPATVELDAEQAELLVTHQELFSRMGFEVEPFGGRAYLLRGVPGLLADRDPARALTEVLDSMAEGGGF